jgi:hypothetical protein
MAKFIRLEGVTFNNANLPILTDLTAVIAALPSLVSWVNAEANNYYLSGSDLVLTDLAANGVEFVKAAGRTTGPSIAANVLNGKSVIRFAGNGGTIGGLKRNSNDVATGAASKVTFALVALVTAPDTATQIIMATDSSSNQGMAIYESGPTAAHAAIIDGTNEQFANGKTWKILICSINDDVLNVLDADDLTTVNTSTGVSPNTKSTLYLGESGGATTKFIGDIAEAIVLNDDIFETGNEANLASILNYLQTKFAV